MKRILFLLTLIVVYFAQDLRAAHAEQPQKTIACRTSATQQAFMLSHWGLSTATGCAEAFLHSKITITNMDRACHARQWLPVERDDRSFFLTAGHLAAWYLTKCIRQAFYHKAMPRKIVIKENPRTPDQTIPRSYSSAMKFEAYFEPYSELTHIPEKFRSPRLNHVSPVLHSAAQILMAAHLKGTFKSFGVYAPSLIPLIIHGISLCVSSKESQYQIARLACVPLSYIAWGLTNMWVAIKEKLSGEPVPASDPIGMIMAVGTAIPCLAIYKVAADSFEREPKKLSRIYSEEEVAALA